MSDQYWLSEAQLEGIKPYFPRSPFLIESLKTKAHLIIDTGKRKT
jgi:hypothetical protein